MSNEDPQYTEAFNAALQWIWGDGYLSPGGPQEIAEMLRDVSVAGRDVIDIGCGLGAIDVELATTHEAGSVLGVDVESQLIDQASARAHGAGVDDRVRFQLIEPGPLPFVDASFDVAFTKDAIIHIPDKAAFYTEVRRVLRPGGVFVGSDWLRGGEETFTERARAWLDQIHLDFQMRNLEQTRAALEEAGFENVSLNDRNAWYLGEIEVELSRLSGDLYQQLVDLIGEERAAYRLNSSTLKKDAIADGFLRPTHFVAHKPA